MTSPHAAWIQQLFLEYDALAARHFGAVQAEAKADGSSVTHLDREASAHVVAALKRHTPSYGIISEEEAQAHQREAEWQWVIDPVDGTASFARGYPVWGLGIGLMHGGEPVEGYLRFPALAETFVFAQGRATRNGAPMHLGPPSIITDTHNVLTASTLHTRLPYARLAAFKLRNLGSSLYHLACLAAGRADAMIVPVSYLWDLAAGLPFTRAAGMIERGLDGSVFDLAAVLHDPHFRMSQPILVGRPDEVEALLKALK